MAVNIILDVLVIVLLAVTLVFGFRLDRRLVALRANQSELNALVMTLNEAASRAEAGVAGLKASAEEAGAGLQSSIERARRLNDELAHRVERSTARPMDRSHAEAPAASTAEEPRDNRKRLEREILNALRAAR